MGNRKQTVHINCVRPLLKEDKDTDVSAHWSLFLFNSDNDDNDSDSPRASDDSQYLSNTRSDCTVHPFDYYRY